MQSNFFPNYYLHYSFVCLHTVIIREIICKAETLSLQTEKYIWKHFTWNSGRKRRPGGRRSGK